MADKENKPRTIIFTPRLEEMVAKLMKEKGYMSFSSVVHQGIIEMDKNYFPAYIQIKDNSPAGKMRRKQEEVEAKEKIEQEKNMGICEELGGKVSKKPGGETFCTYYTYSHKKRYEQEIPIAMVSRDMVKTQYSPSKERVLVLQKEGKTDYKP